jgi:hypothetical protein
MTTLAGSRVVGSRSIATFSATPNTSFISPRELHRAEHDSAFVADLAREHAVLGKEFVTLLDGEQH